MLLIFYFSRKIAGSLNLLDVQWVGLGRGRSCGVCREGAEKVTKGSLGSDVGLERGDAARVVVGGRALGLGWPGVGPVSGSGQSA